MRKLLVRLFNIIFLGCALFAALSLGISPLLTVKVNLKISEENLYTMLVDSGVKTNIERSAVTKTPRRELTSEDEVDILGKLTAERIVYGVEGAPGVGAIETEDPFLIQLPVGACIHPKNQEVIKDFILDNIEDVSWQIAELITPKLKLVIKNVALEVANEIITEQVQAQIDLYFDSSSGQEKPIADKEQVKEIVDNVYALFDENEETSVAQLSTVLIGETNYVVADPQPTNDNYNEKIYYYVKDGENYVKHESVTFDAGTTYYVADYGAGVLGILQDLQEANAEGFEKIDYDNIDTADIENKMVEALGTMPGLTDYKVADPQPTGLISAAPHVYYAYDDATGEYNKVVGGAGESFNPEVTYYDIIIKNADDALIGLMDYYFSKGITKGIKRAAEPAKEKDLLTKSVQDMIKGILPMDKVNSIADKTVNKVTPIILTVYFCVLLFPWALFGLITFFRTFRKNKCWTKLWVVYVFGFIELILGFVLTISVAKLMPKAVELLSSKLPANYQTYVSVLNDSSVSIKTNCFVASFVYLVMIVLGIIYAIIAHRVKVTHKLVKRVDKHDKKYHYDDPDFRSSRYPAYPAYPAYPQFPAYPEYPEAPKKAAKRPKEKPFNEVEDDDEISVDKD